MFRNISVVYSSMRKCRVMESPHLKTKRMIEEHARRFMIFHTAEDYVACYEKGARVWIPHETLVWEGAELTANYVSGTLTVELSDGRKLELKISSDAELPPLRNPEILLGENDLTALSYLHEPAVLHNLRYRFCTSSVIYTYCGIVLVAINPYAELHIYDNDTIWTYRGKSQGDLDPHIFAVAEEAYTRLERESRDQSIIVSGESGAGKTVSAKYVMRYFATVGGSAQETQVEKKVLSSSPIMEAIGNAKTTRNDNSSRFGKFIEIKFSKSYHIVGASMRTYLLEKSRVVFQAPGERNYHIFYQLCSARHKLPHLHLKHQDEFAFLNQGNSPHVDGVDDLETFEETIQALNTLGFAIRDQENLFKILAAILHLGNVEIHKNENEGSAIQKNNQDLAWFAELLDVDVNDIRHGLCNRQIVSAKEIFNKPMTTGEATAAREALSKHMYSQLFNWIVSVVNQALENTKEGADHRFIGVLDIYGFETFEINSFEQFCINYANEKLQQQFNQHVFKLEQEEYLKEGIEWKFIDFYDNQPCIDLIESKLGILDLLDEECRMPNGSDGSWAEKLYKTCGKYKHFSKPRFGTTSYIIQHFADSVEYQADGFLDKNRDSVIEEQIKALRSSQNKFVVKLFTEDRGRQLSVPSGQAKVKITPAARGPAPVGASAKQNKRTVGSQFRDSLNLLMGTLNATTPHYVRCIKPNDEKCAFDYNPQRAVQQLRACGVLETIRISAAGFPSRWLYRDFFLRYRVLCKFKDINRNDMKITCERVLKLNIQDSDKYQFGKTKIFFRAGQVAFLEKLRADKLRQCCIMIQKNIRAFIVRKKFTRIIKSLRLLQRYSRGLIARRKARFLRETKAAITIQRYVRGWVKRHQFLGLRRSILGIQTRIRGLLARKQYQEMRFNHSAKVIQRHVRGFLARRRYARKMRQVVICQSAVRRFLARRRLRALKKEARSVEHIKKLNKGLENKIISLQQRIEDMTKQMSAMKGYEQEVADQRTKLEALRTLEAEKKKSDIALKEKDSAFASIMEKLNREEAEKMDLLAEKMSAIEKVAVLEEKHNQLLKERDILNESLSNSRERFEEELKARLDQERALLHREHEADLENYQKLLKDYGILEQQNETLERQLTSSHKRNPSDTSTTYSSHPSNEFEGDDVGYGSSTRSTTPRGRDLDEQDRSISEMQMHHLPEIDVGLMLKQQQRIKELEKERDRLLERVESFERDESPIEEKQEAFDKLKLEELEIENEKLKRNLEVLRDSIATGDPGTKELLNQFRASEWELDRRRDEIIQLRAVLSTQARGLKNIARINYGSTNDVNLEMINEDGELVVAFEAQKRIVRQLEDELRFEKDRRSSEMAEYRSELERLKEDNERQQKLLAGNLHKTPQSQTEAYMRHEMSRFATDNLHLQGKLDKIQEVARSLKRQNKILLKHLHNAGIKIEPSTESSQLHKVSGAGDQKSAAPSVVIKKERNYQGMFEYNREHEPIIISNLIVDLKPKTASQLLPGLPAYILFMCIRHIDFVNDEGKVRSLLNAVISTVKKVIKKKATDFDLTALWLSNMLRLLHNLKQYSGDKMFQTENSPKQNDQCLRNFDLVQYRQVLSDTSVWIYQAVIRNLQEAIQSLVVPAILENEAIVGLERGVRHRSTSISNMADAERENKKQLDELLLYLTQFHRTLSLFGVDSEVIVQVFKQTFYFICASSLNNLLLRKDLCHWTKGMQIRYNLSHLEQWSRDQKLLDPNSTVNKTLDPIIQASQLLQARKTEDDIKSICDMCDQLTMQRIVKLLNLYTPIDEYEERVPAAFLKKIQNELQTRRGGSGALAEQQGQLMMDSKMVFPVRFPFVPSDIRLEEIEVPDCFELPLNKV